MGVASGHHAGTGRITDRRLAMTILEKGSHFGQPVNIRCLRLRVPAQAAYPIIQIINGNKEDIGFLFGTNCQSMKWKKGKQERWKFQNLDVEYLKFTFSFYHTGQGNSLLPFVWSEAFPLILSRLRNSLNDQPSWWTLPDHFLNHRVPPLHSQNPSACNACLLYTSPSPRDPT